MKMPNLRNLNIFPKRTPGTDEEGDTRAAVSRARARRAARSGGKSRHESAFPIDVGPLPEATTTPLGLGARLEGVSEKKNLAPSRPVSLGFDVPLLLITCTLIIFGLIMVFSASWKYSLWESGDPAYIFGRQALWTGLGVLALLVLSFVNYHHWQKIALPVMIVTILALLAVLIVQDERHGAVRTLFGGSIQPSELAKMCIVTYLSVWLFNRREELRDVTLALLPLGIILGVIGGLITAQPDLSAVLTIIILGGTLFFLAGGDLRQIMVVAFLGGTVGWGIVQSNLFPSGKVRIADFLAGIVNPLDASPHVQRSFESFIKGGWFGLGIGKASTKLTILPFPHTDSIFAVVGEETGLIGAAFMVSLFALLMWRGLVIARQAPDQLGTLLAAGLTFWIAIEAFINMAVMVNLLPFAGNALPLVSAGGSNRVVTLAAIGILINISRLSEKTKEEERIFSAVVDLRRRDWGRGVSGARRPTSPGIRRTDRSV